MGVRTGPRERAVPACRKRGRGRRGTAGGRRASGPHEAAGLLLAALSWFQAIGPDGIAATGAQEVRTGTIRGVVYDEDLGAPLIGVRVTVVEALRTTATAEGGLFAVEGVPVGTYTLAFSKDGYERKVLPGVPVTAGRLTDLRVGLVSEVVELPELVVTGADLLGGSEAETLEARAAAVTLQDAVSAETIRRAGAGDVAGALKLVVGASVVEGRYATIRGLSDRYTVTTVNGVRLPSADPRRRAVPVDLFPTGTVESVTVTKTFTPDLQGDFTGGGVDVRTRSVPEGPILSATLTVETDSQATGNGNFLTYRGGGVSFLASHGEGRELPPVAAEALPALPKFSSRPRPEELEAAQAYDRLTRAFSPVMGVRRRAPGSNESLSLVGGDRLSLGGGAVLGMLGAFTWSHKYDFYRGGRNDNVVVSDPSQPISASKQRTDARGTEEVLVGGLAKAVLRPSDRHELSLQVVANRSAEDEARYQIQAIGTETVEQNQALHYTERAVRSTQLHGTHRIGNPPVVAGRGRAPVRLEWTAAASRMRQDEPDVRFFRNRFSLVDYTAEMPPNSTPAQNTRRIFRDITEDDLQGSVNVAVPFTWAEREGEFKAGLFYDRTDRDHRQRSFTYLFPNQFGSFTNPAVLENRSYARFQASSPDELWTDVFLDPERIGLASNSPPAPNQLLWVVFPLGDDVDYTGEQSIEAAYAMAEVPLRRKLRLVGGIRYETTALSVVPFNEAIGRVEVIQVLPSGDRAVARVPQEQEDVRARIADRSVLPSLGLTYEPRPAMNLRLSYGRTLARPTFRELAPVATEEFIFGDEVVGNPRLTLSKIENFDLRWEWFPKQGEIVAASLFRKELREPIELISFSTSNRSFIQPVNYPRGRLHGLEVETRLDLGRLSEGLHGFAVGGNLSIIASEVDVPDFERESLAAFGLDQRTRRLQGQPDSLLNLYLTYEDGTGDSMGIFFNRAGRSLRTGSARGVEDGVPDVFEEPFSSLDVKFTKALPREFAVSVRGQNLLRSPRRTTYRTPDGQEAVKSERETGRVVSLSLEARW